MVALGNFNTKSSNWYNMDNTRNEGRKIHQPAMRNIK